MRALYWNGVNDLRVGTVKDPEIVNPRDAILKVRLSTTCGSDLHFIDGYIPTMKAGDVIGHEFMGEVVEVGQGVKHVKKGDRVVVPSFIACGECWYCHEKLFSLCDCTHPKPELQEPLLGYPTAGIYGYTHAFGGYAGAHAQFVRVPFADNDCYKAPDGLRATASLRTGRHALPGIAIRADSLPPVEPRARITDAASYPNCTGSQMSPGALMRFRWAQQLLGMS